MSLIKEEELFLGLPISLQETCMVYPLTISEIYKQVGIDNYNYYVNLLTMDELALESILKNKVGEIITTNPFESLMLSAENDGNFLLNLKNAFSTFIKEKVLISPKHKIVIVGNPQKRHIINKQNFQQFQDILRRQNYMEIKEPPPENESEHHRKFRLKREERERVKAKQQVEKGEIIEFVDTLSSLCAAGIGITPFNIGDLTIFQAKELLERVQAREKYHSELDMLMAGADSKKIKPRNWVIKLQKEAD